MIAIYPSWSNKQADRTVAVASATCAASKDAGGLTGLTDGNSLCQRGRVGTGQRPSDGAPAKTPENSPWAGWQVGLLARAQANRVSGCVHFPAG